MPHRKPRRIFFGGTDTEVGKTYVTSLVAKHLHQLGRKVGVYKPVASGCQRVNDVWVSDDAVSLWNAAGKPLTLQNVCPQCFEKPLAPPQAAAAEGKQVDINLLLDGLNPWQAISDILLIEGAGGLFSPIAEGLLSIKLAMQMNADLILVAENRLGVIHQVISTCVAAKSMDCEPLGIILSHPKKDFHESMVDNPAQIEKYTGLPVLATVFFEGDTSCVAGIESTLEPKL
jgi:dethiobiotin synthetase